MIVEQMSEHREQQALQSHSKTPATSSATDTAGTPAAGAASTADTGKGQEKAGAVGHNTYGVLVNTCVIRDLGTLFPVPFSTNTSRLPVITLNTLTPLH